MTRRTPWPASVSQPLVSPLQPSVVYTAQTPDALDAQYEGVTSGYTYSREGHPNAQVLGRHIDVLEAAPNPGTVTGSGMAAVTAAMLATLNTGDHVVAGNQLYGRSLRLLTETLPALGITATLVDPTDAAALKAAIRPETRLILVEVVSNPTLRVADMEGILALAKDAGVPVAVDNTFTTPRAYRPFAEGADIVIHSVTKLLSGHSDVMAGYVAARDAEVAARIDTLAVTMGLTASPFDCWLAERGLLTFDLRFERAQENAAALADHLSGLPGVTRVLYPTRSDHPDHNRAQALLDGKGGNMVSFVIEGGRAQANALAGEVAELAFAPTLGDVSTTVSHPASSSHRALSADDRAALGMPEGFFRVSVGIEPLEVLRDAFTRSVVAAQSETP